MWWGGNEIYTIFSKSRIRSFLPMEAMEFEDGQLKYSKTSRESIHTGEKMRCTQMHLHKRGGHEYCMNYVYYLPKKNGLPRRFQLSLMPDQQGIPRCH